MSNTLSAKDRIKRAGPPTKTVPVWLGADLDLIEQYEAALAELGALEEAPARGKKLADASPRPALEARVEELRQRLDEYRMDFRLRGFDAKRWQALVAEHPPRKAEDGSVDPRDGAGWNRDTFAPALIRAATVSPELDDEDWANLFGDDDTEGALTEPEAAKLAVAALELSRRSIDVPFSSAASPSPPTSSRD